MENTINRELSWLSFNARVLQEAMDKNNPILERIRFMGIFSNNRDEFFRVRVATIKRMIDLGKVTSKQLYADPEKLLTEIKAVVVKQELAVHKVFKSLMRELKNDGIYFVDNEHLSQKQAKFVLNYFKKTVRPTLVPLMLTSKGMAIPELTDKASYLAIKLYNKGDEDNAKYALIEIPSQILSRFFVLPKENEKNYVMFMDDVIRLGLQQVFKIFGYSVIESYAIKLTRDAELDIEEDLDESVTEKLMKSLSKRKKAQPVRFIHDRALPEDFLDFLVRKLKITNNEDIISSGRYHNMKDFINFPNLGNKNLSFEKHSSLSHPDLEDVHSLIDVITQKDIMLNYPFQSFSHTIDILREAAIDPNVQEIKINIYRIAYNSKVMNAIINASKNGKAVTVVVELRARFDEEANIYWSKKLNENGIKVIFGVEGLKVHSKLILIVRKKKGQLERIAHVGTGNFHEGTANLYTDTSLWTANPKITKEVSRLFDFFKNNYNRGTYRELIVAPFNMRRKLYDLIDTEIKNAKAGKKAYIIVKLNNLDDPDIIKRLYKANKAGVKIQMIIRGICSLVPGVKGLSENIEVVSILDRYLEHSRILVFANDGNEQVIISSADWMARNLDRRIEVSVPIYSEEIKKDLREVLDLQLKDNCKARIIDQKHLNKYKTGGEKIVRSQNAIYEYYQSKSN